MKKILFSILMLLSLSITGEGHPQLVVSEISALQRWPWSKAVDIDFKLSLPESLTNEKLGAKIKIFYTVGGNVTQIPPDQLSRDCVIGGGYHRIVWTPADDFPSADLKNVSFSIETGKDVYHAKYMRVELETGKVKYMDDTYQSEVVQPANQTTHMVFRYIPPTTSSEWKDLSGGKDSFTIGAGDEAALDQNASDRYREKTAEVRLTKGFWMGVCPVTYRQLYLLGYPVSQEDLKWKGKFAAFGISYVAMRGSDAPEGRYCFPNSKDVDPDTPIGRLRSRTGLAFDFPTEAQWEYACRAGTTTPYWWGSAYDETKPSFSFKTMTKGPNPWGLYDMNSCCHNWTTTLGRRDTGNDNKGYILHQDATDPQGEMPTYSTPMRITRGSHFSSANVGKRITRSAYRYPQNSFSPIEIEYCGARFSLTEE